MNERKRKTGLDSAEENGAKRGRGVAKEQTIARTVEECLWISVGTFRARRKGLWRTSGVLEWRGQRTGRLTLVARYRIRINGCPEANGGGNLAPNFTGDPVLLLAGAGPSQTIRFRASGVTFGRRYYFLCPQCERRCSKLFLPIGNLNFRCRRCHSLCYQSQSHKLDWFYRPLAASTGVRKRLLKQYLHGIGQSVLREAD